MAAHSSLNFFSSSSGVQGFPQCTAFSKWFQGKKGVYGGKGKGGGKDLRARYLIWINSGFKYMKVYDSSTAKCLTLLSNKQSDDRIMFDRCSMYFIVCLHSNNVTDIIAANFLRQK